MKNAALFVGARQNVTQLLRSVFREFRNTHMSFVTYLRRFYHKSFSPPPNLYVRDYTSKNNTYILLGFVPEFTEVPEFMGVPEFTAEVNFQQLFYID